MVFYVTNKDPIGLKNNMSSVWSTCGGLLIGAMGGMYACYLFSPLDYMSGISLMRSINGSKNNSSYFSVIELVGINYEILIPIFLMIIFGLIGVFKNKAKLFGEEIGLLILYLWSIGLLVGFLQSGWIGDGFPRYYLPSLLISGVFVVTQIPYVFNQGVRQYLTGLFLIFMLCISTLNIIKEIKKYNSGRSITVPGNYVDRKRIIIKAAAESKKDPYAVAVISPTIRYYFPSTNFISIDIGMNDILAKELPNSKYYLVAY